MKLHTFCDQDRELLVSYLYDEIDADDRERVERHLAGCRACAAELAQLRDVRLDLTAWTPPDAATVMSFQAPAEPTPAPSRWSGWGWAAGAAAAGLVLAVSAAIANVEVRYGADGVVVRTGWAAQSPTPAAAPGAAAPIAPASTASPASDAAWRAELTALEDRLRGEWRSNLARMQSPDVRAASARGEAGRINESELMARVTQLIGESEGRQQRQLALRLTQAARENEVQRRADLVRIAQGMDQMQGLTNAEVERLGNGLQSLVRATSIRK